MRLTIVPEDGLVLMDGVSIEGIDMSGLLERNVHAIQWNGTKGEIESNVDGRHFNDVIYDIGPILEYIEAHREPGKVPEKSTVRKYVESRQKTVAAHQEYLKDLEVQKELEAAHRNHHKELENESAP